MEIVGIEEFLIMGITVRTINKDGQSQKDIGELWGRFMSQNLLAQIPNKESDEIYCMYTDYESDFTGWYTTILGCKVSSLEKIPEGFSGKKIPGARYAYYKATGQLPNCVAEVWRNIWQEDAILNRKYLADFDVYGQKAQNMEHAEVDIYISIK